MFKKISFGKNKDFKKCSLFSYVSSNSSQLLITFNSQFLLELPNNWHGDKLFKLRKSKFLSTSIFLNSIFKSIFNIIFNIPLLNNLFTSFLNLFISFNCIKEHTLKTTHQEYRCKF